MAPTEAVRGLLASLRPVGLALARLEPPSLWNVAHRIHIAPQVGLGPESLGCLWIWAQLNLVQAFRSCLMNFPETPLCRLDYVLRAMVHKVA